MHLGIIIVYKYKCNYTLIYTYSIIIGIIITGNGKARPDVVRGAFESRSHGLMASASP